MSRYFNYFPSTYYTSGANNVTSLDVVTNILARFGFEASIKENSAGFYPYQIKDTDTPETIASKFYGDSEKHWVVLLFNDIIDPQYDWPLSYNNFITYVDKKYQGSEYANSNVQYAGVNWAQNDNHVHSYYKLNTRTTNANVIDKKTIVEKIQIDANAYANVSVTTTQYTLQNGTVITESISKEKKTYYEYEMDLNENKRSIKLLKPEFVDIVFSEFKAVISQ